MSPEEDSWLVIHMESPARDLVLDMGRGKQGRKEKYSELVTIFKTALRFLGREEIPIKFAREIIYNNSRDAKNAGVDVTLKFQAVDKDLKAKDVFVKRGRASTIAFRPYSQSVAK